MYVINNAYNAAVAATIAADEATVKAINAAEAANKAATDADVVKATADNA